MRFWGVVALAAALAGCVRPATAPLPMLSYPLHEGERQRNLLVLLTGIGASNEVFAREGIIEEIRARGLPFDVVAPDSHYGYYRARTIPDRLKEDVIDPYRRMGYRRIWLAGFSMGGMGSLFFLRSYPREVDGVLLVSPFLGWPPIHREIRRAGGVGAWRPHADARDQWEVMLWSWIKGYAEHPDQAPPIYLGFGSYDIVARDGPPLLATVLPPENVFAVPGNHTVATFKTIFSRHLETLARDTGAPTASRLGASY